MAIDRIAYQALVAELSTKNVTLVAVSKTKPVNDIRDLYNLGQKDFGENYVQELVEKQPLLPKDIRWHFIGHLQSNKVKYIAPFVHLVHGVDSLKLLQEIDKQARKNNRVIDCLLQVFIAQEETKFGLNREELSQLISQLDKNPLPGARVVGFMGMASFTENKETVKNEFQTLKAIFDSYGSRFQILSMGMSSDYSIAIKAGSNMVRIGSLLFGKRV
jgi:pyridoxal phosphate enzyme (YggS family)